MSTSTTDFFSKPLYVLEGGLSTQLAKYDKKIEKHPLWCSHLLQKNPKFVYQTHLDYLRAGADIIKTNTFQASVAGYQRFLEDDLTEKQCRDLIGKAVQVAKDAREMYLAETNFKSSFRATTGRREVDESNRQIYIAGSVGPFGAYLQDGSEYTGEYISKYTIQEIRDWHIPRIECLLASGVDLLAFETMPVSIEAEMLCDLLKTYPEAKAWLSFCCKDDKHLGSGEIFQHVAHRCIDLNPDQIVAVGVNCCKPEYVDGLLKDFNKNRRGKEVPLIVYPNTEETFDKEKGYIFSSNVPKALII